MEECQILTKNTRFFHFDQENKPNWSFALKYANVNAMKVGLEISVLVGETLHNLT
jgi:hypothetical protein